MDDAKIALLRAQAKLLEHEYERRAEKLVPVAAAEAGIRKLVEFDRNSWRSFPAKYAAELAAGLGIDEALALDVLERIIEQHLDDLPEIEIDLTDENGPQKRRGGRPYGRLGIALRV